MRSAYFVTLDMEKDGVVDTSYEMSKRITSALMGTAHDLDVVVYVATSEFQPDETRRRTFLVYVTMTDHEGCVLYTLEDAKLLMQDILRRLLPGRNGFISVAPNSLQPKES